MSKETTKELAKNATFLGSLADISQQAGATQLAPIEVPDFGVPYIAFYSTKSSKAPEIANAIPGISPGQPYLYHPARGYVRLSELKFHLLNRALFWVQRDGDNRPIRATTKNPNDVYGPLKENFETLVLVYVDGEVVPALATFNVAKSQVGRVASKALQEANTPDWLNKSPDHASTSAIPRPEFRFTVSVTSTVKPAKTSGFPTVIARGNVRPTTVGELQVLSRCIDRDDFRSMLKAATSAFESRVSELNRLAGVTK